MNNLNITKKFTSDDFYEKKYKESGWINQRREDAKKILRFSRPYIKINKNSKVLDAGCGSGDFCREIINLYGCKTYGMDLNNSAVDAAKELGVNAIKTDIENKWPWGDNYFDLVIATEIIEHVVNTDFFLQEAKRVLKPNGKIILTTPNLAAWFNRILLPMGIQPFLTEVSTLDKTIGIEFTRKLTPNREPVGHLRVFTYGAIKSFFKFHNYKIDFIKGISPYYLPKYIKIFDILFSLIPMLSPDILIVASVNDKK